MPKNKKSPKGNTNKSLNIENYIVKIGKDLFSNLTIKKDAREAIHKILHCLTNKYVETLVTLVEHNNTKTIKGRDVQSATRILLKGQLAKHGVSEGTKAVTKTLNFQPIKGKLRVSSAEKAGIIIPPSRIESYLRNEVEEHRVGVRQTADSAVYLAAVLHYITAEIIELAKKKVVVDKNHNLKMSAECVHDAIREDNELMATLCSCL